MSVEQRDAFMLLAQASNLSGERRMVGVEVKTPPVGNVGRVWLEAWPIERFAVEGRGRDEFRRRLTGIERSAARIAIDVDDRAGEPRAHQGRAERCDKIVKLVEPPIGVLAREPRIDESRFESQEVRSRMGNADDERRIAALDDEPVGTLGSHRAGFSSPGSAAAPTASMTALPLTRLVAAAMSG